MLLRFDQVEEAEPHSRNWIKAAPDYWMPRSTAAHLGDKLLCAVISKQGKKVVRLAGIEPTTFSFGG